MLLLLMGDEGLRHATIINIIVTSSSCMLLCSGALHCSYTPIAARNSTATSTNTPATIITDQSSMMSEEDVFSVEVFVHTVIACLGGLIVGIIPLSCM